MTFWMGGGGRGPSPRRPLHPQEELRGEPPPAGAGRGGRCEERRELNRHAELLFARPRLHLALGPVGIVGMPNN